ncbi:MAG: LytR C-terminal domain-containing protein [Gemmatimonadales bacterium]
MEPTRRPLLLAALILVVVAGVGVAMATRLARAPESPDALAGVRRVVPGDEVVTIEVLNGSGRRGVARVATRVLQRAGFDVVYFGNAEPLDSTAVLWRRGEDRHGASLVRVLGTGTVRDARDTLRRLDYTVILGQDWQPPPGFVP